jgi:hypothetical protein
VTQLQFELHITVFHDELQLLNSSQLVTQTPVTAGLGSLAFQGAQLPDQFAKNILNPQEVLVG